MGLVAFCSAFGGVTSVGFGWYRLSNGHLEAQHYTACCFHLCGEREKGEKSEKRGERKGKSERGWAGLLPLRVGPESPHLRPRR